MEKEVPIPYYLQVAETIKTRILSGYYKEGDFIPSYRKLEREFNISNATVRKAIDILVQEGLITKKRGVGTNVKKTDTDKIVWELTGNLQILRDASSHVNLETKVLEIKIVPCPKVVTKILSLDPKGKVWQMKKVRGYGNVVMAYYVSYIDPHLGKKITKDDAEKKKFADLLREKAGLKLTRLEQKVEASVANLDIAKILNVSFGFPLLYIENLYYGEQGKPVAFTQIYYRGDKNVYKAVIPL